MSKEQNKPEVLIRLSIELEDIDEFIRLFRSGSHRNPVIAHDGGITHCAIPPGSLTLRDRRLNPLTIFTGGW